MSTIYETKTASDIVRDLELQIESPMAGSGESSLTTDRAEWQGTEKPEDYLDLYKYGWKEGREKVATNMQLASKPLKQVFDTDVKGFMPAIAEFCAGLPDNMLNSDLASRPVVKLAVPYGWNAGVDGDSILKYAGVMASLFSAIREAGAVASLCLVYGSNYGGKEYQTIIEVCDETQLLDIDRVASCFHTSFFRRAVFAHIERHHDYDVRDTSNGGYGRSMPLSRSKRETLESKGYIVAPQLSPTLWEEPETALAETIEKVKAMLKA